MLANSLRVLWIAVHLQGHSDTRDIDRPPRYKRMADDSTTAVAEIEAPCLDAPHAEARFIPLIVAALPTVRVGAKRIAWGRWP
jgi:hypothetical protein